MSDEEATAILEAHAGEVLFLYTDGARDQLAVVAIRKIPTQLDGLKIPYTKIDGMDPANKDLRKAMWTVGKKKPGTYPVVFIGSTYICDGEDSQEQIDCGSFISKFDGVKRAED